MFMTYCLTFLFSHDYQRVALMTKNRGPAMLIGKLCGGGGKVENGETPEEASSRETVEEFGVVVDKAEWHPVASSQGSGWYMDVFSATCDLSQVRTMEDEPVSVHQVCDILAAAVLAPNTIAPDLAIYISVALAKRGRAFAADLAF
jgi:8-oxo-dGTP pyrophosphatase MutT (NUDIX family)